MRDVAQDTRELLYTLEGVRRIDILGLQEERIYMEINPAILSQYELSPQEIFGALSQQNIVQPGGVVTVDSRSVVIEPSGDLKSIEELKAVVFRIPDTDRVLRLDEIATIRRDYVDPPVNPAFFNNKPAIVLAVSTVEGTNNVAFGEDLTTLLDRIEQELPIGYVLDYATFQPELIETAIQGAVSNVYQTLGIVLAVVMLFSGHPHRPDRRLLRAADHLGRHYRDALFRGGIAAHVHCRDPSSRWACWWITASWWPRISGCALKRGWTGSRPRLSQCRAWRSRC